ncbi:TPA: cupredoxin domain-containing protein [Salmonella enterica subsp. enterica serovar Typhimurium]|uniref:Cupredoxin domain-containing protein n=1 Tax=Salmonella enterica I TaxID=59201 RepID=A0A612H775_SALET|nr:cupredoxin domain-containing protein [Salmonella enterica subsp. enterica]EHJ3658405.1 cupredoxin domain-containing protein [Salmonella enterica]HDO5799895.1 cupredoxin domain-containing protein [Salmonella enterica subsp. enterica serovar Typhimurium]
MRLTLTILLFISLLSVAWADERPVFNLELTEKGFIPEVINVPANTRIQIKMLNSTSKVAELESFDMKFEKIATPGNSITVRTGPLHPGVYTFFDDYSINNFRGKVVAKDSLK